MDLNDHLPNDEQHVGNSWIVVDDSFSGLSEDDTDSQERPGLEVLLLSWMIVLLRTRDNGQVTFEWTLKTANDASVLSTVSFSTPDVMQSLDVSIADAEARVSEHLATARKTEASANGHCARLLVSTASLSQATKRFGEDDVLHLGLCFHGRDLEVTSEWQTAEMPQRAVARYVDNLKAIVELCTLNRDTSVIDLFSPNVLDLEELWSWNHELPPTYDFCMHEMVSERATNTPHKVAVEAWDGTLTYDLVDLYSTQLACTLSDSGTQAHDVVPICFEKSRWAIIAVLAVMKAGSTFVLMDPTLPLARLQDMARQTGARKMLTSRCQHELSKLILPGEGPITVEASTFDRSVDRSDRTPLLIVPASSLMYIIFTSGSTGSPKGVKISHSAYTSSAIPRAKAVGYTKESRVLDFASYAFDVSIDSMLLTLGNGGCLCIPSDEDRMNDINGAMRKMKVNYAGLTPSVGRILDAAVISSLEGLGLGGEAVSARDVTNWGKDARIIIGYGPCECTIGCTVNGSAATGRDYISIGPGNGAAIWVVHPDDHNTLMPVGAVGELLVEGPIVGQGYLNDPEKTAASFIKDPTWLLAGHGPHAGRSGRLYKTGDLGRYDPDGSGGIVFVGRKDTQVKLRGQRVELGEIESQLKARLPSDTTIVAEVIPSGEQLMLVAFVACKTVAGRDCTELESITLPEHLRQCLDKALEDLAEKLPRYMIPAAYIPVNFMPVLISGKTDRRKLKQFGASVDLRNLDAGSTATPTRPLNDLELHLRHAWSHVLKRDAATIGLEENFFAAGGDSVLAMRLVALCRAQGLNLNVATIFNHATLASMAEVVRKCDVSTQLETPVFSLISQDVEQACLEAARACGVEAAAVEDIYPCTPTQESLFTFSLKSLEPYVAQRVARIPSDITTDAWKTAWEVITANSPILRTRVAQLSEVGLQQVVLKQAIHWVHSPELESYLANDTRQKMDLGQSLARYAIIDSQDGARFMVWTVHHVLYDGWSEQLILRQVSQALAGQELETPAQIKDFVSFLRSTEAETTRQFWAKELNGAVGPQFPHLPSRDYLPTPDGFLERHILFRPARGSPFTTATYIRGAWALVASQYTSSDDVVFGETLIGRDIALPAVEGIIGPLIATLPVRVRIDRASSVRTFLQSIQQSMSARTPHQHMGMQNIRNVSADAQHACEAPTGLVVQLAPENVGEELGFEHGDVVREALHFNPYPLMLACGIQKDGFRVCASFDTGLIDVRRMEAVLAEFEMACSQLATDLNINVGTISCVPTTELDQIWEWNQTAPLDLEPSGWLRVSGDVKHGSPYPPAAVSWVCDPRNSSLLSPIGCVGELCLEGNIFPHEATTTPGWLKSGSSSHAGRSGKVQPTGDLVRQLQDGSIVFVRRKDQTTQVNGHDINIDELEHHVRRHLSEHVRAAATTFSAYSDLVESVPERTLVVFVEERASQGLVVDLLTGDHRVSCVDSHGANVETTILAQVSANLVASLKKLDKFSRDSLPSYMVPSTYVVVDRLPTNADHVDQAMLENLGSNIPPTLLIQMRKRLALEWAKASNDTSFTASEIVLRAAWAILLVIDKHQIDNDDNFFRLGGDSVLAMRLVSNLRMQGHELTVADIFKHMRLGDAAKVLKLNHVTAQTKLSYRAFSTVRHLGLDSFMSDVVRPQLADRNWPVKDVLTVTDSQALDIEATIHAPRTSVQYTSLFFDAAVDQERLLQSCRDLVKTHEILRTVFIKHDSAFYQVILGELEAGVIRQAEVGDLDQHVKSTCEDDINIDLGLGSPWVNFFLAADNAGRTCLSIRLSHAQYDGVSLPRMLEDLSLLYAGSQLTSREMFSTYIAQVNNSFAATKAQQYWRDLLNGSSLSGLGLSPPQPASRSVFQSKQIDISLCSPDFTTANLLTAAWALLLARRLHIQDVTFGNVTSGRNIDIPNAQDIVGPCYQFTPVRVLFQPVWTALDLLRFVQVQTADSAAHDFLGFGKIAKQCTQWPADAEFFDSLVHHQDVIEETESMSFGDGECRVEVVKPHGDAAYPLKVVSFTRGGRTHVGVVGSERDDEFVTEVLAELAITVEELAACTSEQLFGDNPIY